MEDAAEGVAVAGQPPIVRGQRINKRSLRNKSLSVTFNEKDLRDFVSGFHKRKKKRRKEALRKQEEAERRRRLEKRKRARLEKEYALYGGAPPASDTELDGEDQKHDDESELNPSVSGTATYENGDVMVTVTTSEITPEEIEHTREKSAVPLPQLSIGGAGKKHNIPVSKKKPFKKATKGKSRPKLHTKRDRRKGKKNNKKRH